MIVIFFIGCFDENKIDKFPMEIYSNKVIKSIDGKWIVFTNGTNVNIEHIIFVNFYDRLGFKRNVIEISLKHKKSIYILVNNYNICKKVTERINKAIREYKNEKSKNF